ncbi:MAG: flagellar basal-body rod protein FlgF [Proteobacteria bacterium]|jgi:flagellar basal-body rod protein FlgF|nr:flagellar basal-body rod protein FlgF [Methylibium sp.]MBY0364773.1 flagellar basal-body rod protein FlgF [Burkholderiaceae bacterium]MCH8855515.1 flagellar basal-body rod protein FlgF [Pseudomonadota bacterium]RTL24033.1 MAG: flagellar basal-body rod protein FlgF [Burkholderiales bacterium]|mmetsp:Transcript_22402/g.88702  ORF Transcript_22402/g.88702 Transcript_22402/m.88702 type:complete len:244 (+) Transcript_22402:399-1130(+)
MDRMIYLSMAGAKAAMQRQDVLSHNLANVTTNGFRAELQAFRAVPVRGDGASTRAYGLETSIGYNDEPGPLTPTGRNLDVAMQGKAWLAVQANDGTEAYTRAGSLDVSGEGLLVMRNGMPVLGDGGPINVPPNSQLSIGSDGTVTAKAANQRPTTIGRLKLVTPETAQALSRGDDGLFRAPNGDLPVDPTARLQDGALEGSNVSPVETMVAMISASRQFEQQMKLLQIAQTQGQQSAKLLGST